jgi:NTP pyrophosphatase (non-canonical NTP hydrolase)
MSQPSFTLAEFQKHIAGRYEAADRARGWAKTFAYFVEEVGELATALSAEGKDPENLREEFADVLAWLCTLANVSDVDLSGAVAEKYLGEKRPEGTK